MRDVLVVDDHPDLADAIALLLQDQGFATRVAHSAEEALDEAKRRFPEIAILDIRLPGIGGLELANRLRRAAPLHILLIAFTGSMLAAENANLSTEFDAVIRKPASLDDIMLAIRTATSGMNRRIRSAE